ncbi:MAG: hypothetical protein WA081_10585 [Desulfosalsimonadaceae bacterium]
MNKKTFLNFLIVAALTLMVLPTSALCELKNLDDDGLSAVYAEGFSDFTITDLGGGLSETYALFNIRANTYTTVDSLKLGYHNEYDYKDPTPVYAWDEDWVDLVIGTNINDPTTDFLAEGLYMRADFTNINDPATRELKSFAFGVKYVKGDISAIFNSFSGTINDGVGGPEYNGHALNLGPVTITADPNNTGTGGFDISLSIDTYDKGYWVTIPNAIVTP